MLICHRLKQFREYNKLDCKQIANALGVTEQEYIDFESNKTTPTIDTLTTITRIYKITLDEFYGNHSHLALRSREHDMLFDDASESTLKMSDLSWDEAQLILYYRAHKDDDNDEIIKKILEKNNE